MKANLINQYWQYFYQDKSKSFLEQFRKQQGLQPFRIKQIFYEIFKNSRIDFESMTTLSKDLRKSLAEQFEILSLKPEKILDSENTTKIAFSTSSGDIVESVLMYHYHTIDGKRKLNRITLCVSSQVGCAVGCKFCVTGKLGFKANLTFDQIISQLLFANWYVRNKFWKKQDGTYHKVRNVVFMWMGEPLLNFDEVEKAIKIMLDQNSFSLSKRHITISTSWIIPGIEKLIEKEIPVMLAVSLHAPNQKDRQTLMPISQKYNLLDLMKVLEKYWQKTWNRIFYEYIMIDWYTDRPEQAKQLVELLKGQNAHINLIPYNENPAIDFKESKWENILKFKKILEKGGLTVTIRDSLWRELKWACGQLGYEKVKCEC